MFEKQFNLRYFEMNKWGEASPLTIAALIQEAASDHCDSIDHGLFSLYAQNIGWVLLSSFIKMERYPVFKEKVFIHTWISSYTSTRSYRESLIYDGDRNIIGRSRALWVFFDTIKKRPVRIFNAIVEGWPPIDTTADYYDINDKLTPIEDIACRKNFDIYQYDLDANNHVNNLRYLQWAMETVPEEYFEEKQLTVLNARYLKEAYYGQSIESLTSAEGEDDCFRHSIRNATTGEFCATASTQWRSRMMASEKKIYQFA